MHRIFTENAIGLCERYVQRPHEFVPYPRAIEHLRERLGATPEELAVWVMLGSKPELGGINGYLNANELNDPPVLHFGCWSEADFDYIAPLMSAWFDASELEAFDPPNRFIIYGELVKRWGDSKNIADVEAYIFAKVRESRLMEVHPATGLSELTLPDWECPRPAKGTTLFFVADIEAVEKEDGIHQALNESPATRRARLQSWFKQEQRKKSIGALIRTAKREGISRQTLSKILERDM